MATQNSQLIANLQSIYNTKLEIKEVIGTTSDIFEDYPSYISAAIAAGGEIPAGYTYVSGTSYITTNGEHNVSSYAYAYITIEGEGGITPSGNFSYTIQPDGQHSHKFDVYSYAYAYISVLWAGDYAESLNMAEIIINGNI